MGALANLLQLLGRLLGSPAPASPTPDESAGIGGGTDEKISHALVLPDQNFIEWYRAAEAYSQFFERVAVIRSPAGNDLNRYRNISAVEAPNVWLDNNALMHIRRIYRSVVRVDTIKVSTPAQLKSVLQQRIDRNDRYGEWLNDGHIDDRFVLGWPADALPARIVVPFNVEVAGARNEGLMLYAPIGTTIRAPISGTVTAVARQSAAYGAYVQIGATHKGTVYRVTLTHLKNITVSAGQPVSAGSPLALSDQDTIKLILQTPGQGLAGYPLPDIADPTDRLYWNTLRLRPTDNGLRVRTRPGTAFEIVTQVNATDDLETLEMHGRTLAKVGVDGQWINVRTPNGKTGYSAAWFLQAVSAELIDRARLTGVNLDLNHPLGRPAPARLGNIGWVRFVYNVSYNPQNNTYGSTDLNRAYSRYRPFIEQYARAGYKVILVLTHQTYGEGAGFEWGVMDSAQWRLLTGRFAQMAREIAGQYAGQDLVYAYQIWNEQDAAPGSNASVPMPAGNYAFLLSESLNAIRAVDLRARLLTGGHMSGPWAGANYVRTVLRALPPGVLPDGIAIHPYGRGATPGLPYAPFGHIDDELTSYRDVLPGKPLWITEWGVLDQPQAPAQDISRYAVDMVNHVRTRHPGRVAAMAWFAWAQGMHNGYGLVGTNDEPRQPLYDSYIRL